MMDIILRKEAKRGSQLRKVIRNKGRTAKRASLFMGTLQGMLRWLSVGWYVLWKAFRHTEGKPWDNRYW